MVRRMPELAPGRAFSVNPTFTFLRHYPGADSLQYRPQKRPAANPSTAAGFSRLERAARLLSWLKRSLRRALSNLLMLSDRFLSASPKIAVRKRWRTTKPATAFRSSTLTVNGVHVAEDGKVTQLLFEAEEYAENFAAGQRLRLDPPPIQPKRKRKPL